MFASEQISKNCRRKLDLCYPAKTNRISRSLPADTDSFGAGTGLARYLRVLIQFPLESRFLGVTYYLIGSILAFKLSVEKCFALRFLKKSFTSTVSRCVLT